MRQPNIGEGALVCLGLPLLVIAMLSTVGAIGWTNWSWIAKAAATDVVFVAPMVLLAMADKVIGRRDARRIGMVHLDSDAPSRTGLA